MEEREEYEEKNIEKSNLKNRAGRREIKTQRNKK
jgi:hypothetical protein